MEGWIGSRISSPYVVKVVEPPRPRSCLYYLTEYVQGVTLTRWMRENSIRFDSRSMSATPPSR